MSLDTFEEVFLKSVINYQNLDKIKWIIYQNHL